MKRLLLFCGSMILALALTISCIGDDDYSLPELADNPRGIPDDTLTIAQVKAIFTQRAGYFGRLSGDEQFTFHDTEAYMTGVVVSSDETGNFYQELILQDARENPSAGIKIMIQADPLYTRYEIGQKVFVELSGFTIGFSNGVMALGVPEASNNYIGKAPRIFLNKINRSLEKKELKPLEISLSELLEGNHDLLYVKLIRMQFDREIVLENPLTFAGEAEDYFDAERFMESCDSKNRIYLLTSTFSDFTSWLLPQGNGAVSGIVVKTFNGSDYALKLNYPDELRFTEERCTSQNDDQSDIPPDEDTEEVIFPSEDAQLAFVGADFEDWEAFINGLNGSGVPTYAQQVLGEGIFESAGLHLKTTESTTNGNDYLFIAPPIASFPEDYRQIVFYVKGISDKSLSVNLYKSNGEYYRYNLKNLTKSANIGPSGSNQYTGKIDTNGEWVRVSLDVSRITDLNTRDTGSDFIALKIGKNANYDLYIDHFIVE